MSSFRLNRRQVLRGAGGVAIGLPLLHAMLPNKAAAASIVRRRFLTVVSPNGTIPSAWFPTGTATDFQLSPILAPLEPHLRDLIVMKGIDNRCYGPSGSGHGQGICSLLSGRPLAANRSSGITLDQEVASLFAKDPNSRTPYRSFELGSWRQSGQYDALSYAGSGMALPKISTAANLFKRIFSGGVPGNAVGATSAADLEALRVRRASILDRVLADYARLQPRLGADDRQRVGAHLNAIREVEQRLSLSTNTCIGSAFSPGKSDDNVAKLPEMWKEMLDVWVLALSCDLSRVGTYMFRTEGASPGWTFGWLGIGPDGNPYASDNRDDAKATSHHSMSHFDYTADNRARLIKVNNWFMQQLAMLVERLKATPDGPNATLFDGTTILYGSPIAVGAHTLKNMPFLLIGSAGGHFKTGQFLTYTNVPHNNLLTSVYQAMGGEGNFGDPMVTTGPLAGLG